MEATLNAAQEPLHFPNPPIVEAIIGIDIEPIAESAIESIKSIEADMASLGYASPSPVMESSFEMKIEAGNPADIVQSARQLGLRFLSSDNLYSAQLSFNGFLFSRLGSYDSWVSFRDEALRVWTLYNRAIGPTQFTGFGVRYINKVFIPFGENFDDYLKIYGHTPDPLSGPVTEYLLRMAFPLAKPQGQVTHQQILLPTERDGFATILLDNDFRFSAIGFSAEQIWVNLEEARRIKNNFFINTVTDKMVGAFS